MLSSGPPSPDPSARRSPYSRASQDSPDFLSGLLPKALSPTPYTPLERSGLMSASPAASPVTVSALSHYSSSTVGLEELQICGMDSSPTATATPSPTLSHASNAPDELPTAPSAATGTNVTITLTGAPHLSLLSRLFESARVCMSSLVFQHYCMSNFDMLYVSAYSRWLSWFSLCFMYSVFHCVLCMLFPI